MSAPRTAETQVPSLALTGDTAERRSVKDALTPRVEVSEFAAFSRRIIRAYARRVADADIDALPEMVKLSADLDRAIADAVLGLRSTYSWGEIASRLDITRQAAQQRWGRTDKEGTPS